jgi:hypothetical protein
MQYAKIDGETVNAETLGFDLIDDTRMKSAQGAYKCPGCSDPVAWILSKKHPLGAFRHWPSSKSDLLCRFRNIDLSVERELIEGHPLPVVPSTKSAIRESIDVDTLLMMRGVVHRIEEFRDPIIREFLVEFMHRMLDEIPQSEGKK